MKKIVNVEGMSCGHCAGRVTKSLSCIDGVSDVNVNLDEKKVLIDLNREVPDEQINKAIEEAGYKVVGIKAA